jgi:cytochrome c oxidase subunit 1
LPSPPPAHNFDVIPRVRSVSPMQDVRNELRARYRSRFTASEAG